MVHRQTPAQHSCGLIPEVELRPYADPLAHGRPRNSISAELEFAFYRSPPEVSLVFWTGVFLSPGRRIRVTGKETGPGPGGYG